MANRKLQRFKESGFVRQVSRTVQQARAAPIRRPKVRRTAIAKPRIKRRKRIKTPVVRIKRRKRIAQPRNGGMDFLSDDFGL